MGGSAELPPGVVPEGRARTAALWAAARAAMVLGSTRDHRWAKPADGPSEGCLGADVGA